ncbi:MAG: NUDIX domain-containing protein [Caldilineaceae bacterium]
MRLSTLLLKAAYGLMRLRWRILRPVTFGVRIMLIRKGQVLLVDHTYLNMWHFPGGHIHRGEMPLAAAKREAFEEAGVTCDQEPWLLGIFTNFVEGKTDNIALFVCEEFTIGERSDRWEIAEQRFFPFDALPADVAPACRRRIADYLAGDGPYAKLW